MSIGHPSKKLMNVDYNFQNGWYERSVPAKLLVFEEKIGPSNSVINLHANAAARLTATKVWFRFKDEPVTMGYNHRDRNILHLKRRFT